MGMFEQPVSSTVSYLRVFTLTSSLSTTSGLDTRGKEAPRYRPDIKGRGARQSTPVMTKIGYLTFVLTSDLSGSR